jgi:outer membrane protein TolC
VKHRLLALACAVATVLPAAAWAQDLLTVWQAAAQHDRQLAVARAERAATQTLREQADALWRPSVSLAVSAGLGAQDTAMRGARFRRPAWGRSTRRASPPRSMAAWPRAWA